MRSVGPSPGFVFAMKADIAGMIQGQPGRGTVCLRLWPARLWQRPFERVGCGAAPLCYGAPDP
eukprot:3700259-Prymnesium_polylepis.1